MKILRNFATMMLVAVLALQFTSCKKDEPSDKGGEVSQKIAIVDAGSSGTRLYVYEVSGNTVTCVFPTTKEEKAASKTGALSNLKVQADSVKKFLNTLTACYTQTSSESIPLYILATAGMRMVPQAEAESLYTMINSEKSAPINGFQLKEAKTISGRYEGLYSYIDVNLVNNTLYSSTPLGIFEVGGASMQLAFKSNTNDIPTANKIVRDWGTIYSRSYLGGGADQVYADGNDHEAPFTFTVPLEDVSRYYIANTTFSGQGKPVTVFLAGVKEKGTVDEYVNSLVFNPATDQYHAYMNGYYIKWATETLNITGKFEENATDGDWTVGAAYDIVINSQQPESFDYNTKN